MADNPMNETVTGTGEATSPVLRIPGYEFINEIGRGGQATVYRARRITDGLLVAVKVLHGGQMADADARQRFEREIITLRALNHPNIARVLGHGQSGDGHEYLVMNFIEGHTLDRVWQRPMPGETPPDPAAILRLFKRICDAMNFAHLRGVTHRDLSPSNIRIDARGEPHILDFGLARTAFDRFMRHDAREVSVTGQFLGKLAYASPEQARGKPDDIDIRTDVYALGVLLYQIVTHGRFPYEVVGTLVDVLNNIITVPPTPPSKVLEVEQPTVALPELRRLRTPLPPLINPTIEAIVLRALEKDVERRYQSAGELAEDIGNYLDGRPTYAQTRALNDASNTSGRRGGFGPGSRLVLAAAAVLILVITSVAVWVASAGFRSLSRSSGQNLNPATKAPGPAGPAHGSSSPLSASPAVSSPDKPGQPTSLPSSDSRIDLIGLVDPLRDAVRGQWAVTDHRLAARVPAGKTTIEFPYRPPAEYDLRVVFTYQSPFFQNSAQIGHDGLRLIFPAGGKQFTCVLAAFGNKYSYFEEFGGQRAAFQVREQWIKPGSTNTFDVKIRTGRVETMLNGVPAISHKTDFRDASVWGGDRIRYGDILGVGTWGNSITVLTADLTEVTGRGSALQRPGMAPATQIAEKDPGAEDGWINLYNGKSPAGWRPERFPTGITASISPQGVMGIAGVAGALVTDRTDLADFHLRGEFMIARGADDRLLFRAARGGMTPERYELVLSDQGSARLSGSIVRTGRDGVRGIL